LLRLEKAGVDFVAVDTPNANRLTVCLIAVIAQEERAMIAAKARGVKLEGKQRIRRTSTSSWHSGARACVGRLCMRRPCDR